jgi:2-hydroxy-6-oxonona-2,4-dienedioate hydrolase
VSEGTIRYWPRPSVTNHVLRTSRGPVEFAQAGEGPPVLYFHGTGAGNDLAFPIERRLLDDGFRLIVMNRPGYYGTPIHCGRSAAACAELAAELLDSLGVEKAAVIGTSGGGIAAGSFASRYPDRTVALVLQCAQAHRWEDPRWLPEESRWLYPILRNSHARRLVHSAYFLQVRCQRWLPNQVLKGMCGKSLDEVRDDPATNELCRILIESSIQCLAETAGIRNDTDLLFGDNWIQPGTIHCPTLVVHDRSDPRVPVAHADWAVECIPHAERCEVTGCGHLIWIGRGASRMHEARVAFLRRCCSGRDRK